MHYFNAETKHSLPPIRNGIGRQGKPWGEKYFKPELIGRLIRLWQDLEPDGVCLLFIDGQAVIQCFPDYPEILENAVEFLENEADKPIDGKGISLTIVKDFGALEISQTFKIKKFAVHDTRNFTIKCCARIIPDNCRLSLEKKLKKIKRGFKLFAGWLDKTSGHEIFTQWGFTPRFSIWQEVAIPQTLITEVKTWCSSKLNLPLPGEELKNPEHIHHLRLAWLLTSCKYPVTKLTIKENGELLHLPQYVRHLKKAVLGNPSCGIRLPLITELAPRPQKR